MKQSWSHLLTVMTLAGVASGCNKGQGWTAEEAMKKMSGPSPQELVAMAFDPKDADRRREGVCQLSQRSWGRQEKYCKGYALLVHEDADPTVRAAAVQALGRAEHQQFLIDVASALDDSQPTVRLNAAMVLDEFYGDPALAPLRQHALEDSSVDVRMWCAKALRHFRRQEALTTLQQCLKDSSFGVTYQTRASLKELTGRDHGYSPDAWDAVLHSDNPFAAPSATQKDWWRWRNPFEKALTTAPAAHGP